jgi:RND superfamily putative drug exporter
LPARSLAASWGALVARHRWWALSVWAAIFAATAYFATTTPRLLNPAGFSTGTEAGRAAGLLREQFPERRGPVLFLVFQSSSVPIDDAAYQAQILAYRADLERLTSGVDAQISQPLPGRDGRTAGLLVTSHSPPDLFIEIAHKARDVRHPGPAAVYQGGIGAVYDSFLVDSEQDLQYSERVSLPIAVLLLLLVFGGLVAAGLPVITGLATVTATVALLGLVARVHSVSVFSLNVTTALGLGLGIDYSLLVVNRFREELRTGREVEDAVAATVASAGMATVVSGGTVMIGFGALLLSRLNVLWSIGLGGALVVVASVLASLTLIPALLAVFGRRIDALTLPFLYGRDASRLWHRLAAVVMGRPWTFVAVTLAIVLLLAWPARHIDPGVVGAESLPPGDAASRAQEIGVAQLGLPERLPILVIASGVSDAATEAEVERRLREVAGPQPVTGLGSVPPQLASRYFRPPYAVFEVEQPGPDNDSSTRTFLNRLRTASWPPGVHLRLAGEAAAYQDYLGVLYGDFPAIFGLVVGLTLVLLAVAFRSVALPLKAVVMNLLSVAAAMGVLTFVFQEGHFSRLLDFRAVGFVDATVPVLIFAGLFGLSMDYEVFLLSRIREEYLGGRDNSAAVAEGLARTGQIITSAALVMVVVVSTLALSHLSINKSIGVTFGAAVLLDATVIRLLLVPAMMRLLGGLNWWPAGRPEPAAPAGPAASAGPG